MKNYKTKQFVRVIDSTYDPSEETKEMIGDVCEVKRWDYDCNQVSVYTKDKSDYLWFNTSDLQRVWQHDGKFLDDGKFLEKDGYIIGEGDIIDDEWVVYDAYISGKTIWYIRVNKINDEGITTEFILSENFKITPEYQKESKEYTLDEIAKALNIPVEQLKIKK